MSNALPPMGAGMDIVEQVEADHRHARALLQALRVATPESRADRWPELLHLLAVHEVAEEQVVFPAVRGVEPALGPVLAERVEEQRQTEELLVRMEQLDPAGAAFAEDLTRLESAVLAHAAAEEQTVLPVIARHDQVLDRPGLGARYDAAKRRAPTRPHPDAPHGPPGNLVVGRFISFFDRVRDRMEG